MYTYQDFKDKTIEGVRKELQEGITKMAVYFYTTEGLPREFFNNQIKDMNKAEQLMLYMTFRNKNPKIFN